MIADIRTIPQGASLDADVCVIGGGAAGISLAREFLSSSAKVVLLESGGHKWEACVQQLYAGGSVGESYFEELHQCRTRRFGGSTNCWGGICAPLDPIDFEARSWVPWSGWPITHEDLVPYWRRAHGICGAGPFLYDARAWEQMDIPYGEFRSDRFRRFVWHFNSRGSPGLRFGSRFYRELRQAPNIHVLLHANAINLLTNESGRSVERVTVRSLDHRTIQVRAKVFVLACGGIENARILLSCTSQNPKGLGNQRDLVGRFFQEHLQVPCGLLQVDDRDGAAARYSRLSKLGAARALPGLSLTPEAQRVHRTLNGSLAIDPVYEPHGAWMAFQHLRSACKEKRFDQQSFRHFWNVAREVHQLAPELWRRVVHGDRPRGNPHRFVLYARAEQSPNPDSRVILSSRQDALGMRQVCLDWKTTPLDRKAIRLMASFAVDEFTRLNLGQVVQADWLSGESWPTDLVGGPHHMGTTRMADADSSGVVDRNCRVHGVHGLYIAGSSVFPTGGHANPTLTIIALTLRLADHIRRVLSQESAVVDTGRRAIAVHERNSTAVISSES
jgi:choline dehydrogenase-like flavoprotein